LASVLSREQMAERIARDLPAGAYVNLGIGIPTLVANYIAPEREVILHSENGILGMGPEPPPERRNPNLINAGKQYVTMLPGGAFFHQADSFAMTRGRHVDVAVLGGLQVSCSGDLANWKVQGAKVGSIGGAMDIATGAKQVFVVMSHVTREGAPKLVSSLTYAVTALRCVSRVYTDMAVIDVTAEGFEVRELVEGFTREDLERATDAPLRWR